MRNVLLESVAEVMAERAEQDRLDAAALLLANDYQLDASDDPIDDLP